MVTTVYLIRHGRTVGGEEKRYKGRLDVPLSEEGMAQIGLLAGYMTRHYSGSGLDEVYCSDLIRAVKSAEIIAGSFGKNPVMEPAFRERSFGRWEGMSFTEIRNAYPDEFEAWAADPVKFSPVDGESTKEVRERVMPVFNDLIRKHSGQRIAIVAHGGVTRIILCQVLAIPLQNIFRVEQNFGCLNIISYYDDLPVVTAMNLTMWE